MPGAREAPSRVRAQTEGACEPPSSKSRRASVGPQVVERRYRGLGLTGFPFYGRRRPGVVAYLIADTRKIPDADQAPYEEYRQHVGASITEAGGRFLVRGDKLDVVEGDWRPAWLVVIEFPSMRALRSWYDSDSYQELKELRLLSTEGDMVFADGV
jgi:uncharacterized protein (DUF1330 family)